MSNSFTKIAFTPAVRAAQSRYGSREAAAAMELYDDDGGEIHAREKQFIEARDSFYIASVSENDWPYIQHRGGPRGFLKVLDPHTIAFADLLGNRQYLTAGNVSANDKVSLFLMDYPNRRRLKIWGRAEVVHQSTQPDIVAMLKSDAYQVPVERIYIIKVESYSWNCPRHITRRFTEAEVEAMYAPDLAELEALRMEVAELRRTVAEYQPATSIAVAE